jgi:Acetyltransferase (GNAT) domain
VNPARPETWQCYTAQQDFPNYADSWDALNHRFLQGHPLGDSCFVDPLLKYFATGRDFLAVQSVNNENRSMLLLQSGKFGVVNSFRPAQTEICPAPIDSIDDLQSLFDELPLSTLAIQLHCQDPDYSAFPDRASSFIFEVDQHATTVCIDLQGDFGDYWCNRPAKLRQSIDRCLRNLSKNGVDWRFTTVESPKEVELAVDRYGDLEIRGWKRHAGTAVHSTNIQGRFYREVLRRFAERGKGVVYELYFDGNLVSSQLAIASDSMLITLKTCYDEEFGKYSPGKLLDYMTLRHEFELGRFSKIEFCTNARTELIRWGTRSRPVSHITIYRNKFCWRLARVYRKLKSLKPRRALS